jgi:hypothetical protein
MNLRLAVRIGLSSRRESARLPAARLLRTHPCVRILLTRRGDAEMRAAMRVPRFRICGKYGPLIALSLGA